MNQVPDGRRYPERNADNPGSGGTVTDLPRVVAFADTVLWEEVGNELVLLDLGAGEYLQLDDIASAMWKALEESTDTEAAFALLRDAYEVDDERLRSDFAAFIERIVELGLVTVQ